MNRGSEVDHCSFFLYTLEDRGDAGVMPTRHSASPAQMEMTLPSTVVSLPVYTRAPRTNLHANVFSNGTSHLSAFLTIQNVSFKKNFFIQFLLINK